MINRDLFFSFKGRISRKSYWVYCGVPLIVLGVFLEILHVSTTQRLFIFLLILWPSLALHTKRWHDQNKSAWWQLIAAIPLIGWLIVMVMCGLIKGTAGANSYGESPLANTET